MTSVTLLTYEPGRLSMEVGQIDFFDMPVRTARDVQVSPPGVVSFEDAKSISTALLGGPHFTKGMVGRYLWQKTE